MAINPVSFAQKVNEQFLRYQLTAFPFTDPDLAAQAQELFRGTVESPLVKGPYLSLSKAFRMGPPLQELADAGSVHPALPGVAEHPSLFAHQYEVLQATQADRHALVSAGTGSGKTEAFLYPIIDHCLGLRDAGAPPGVVAILVYPMNALAIDQLGRLRRLLAGTGVTFGMYVGSTPADEPDAGHYVRLDHGQGRDAYTAKQKEIDRAKAVVSPWEERVTEKGMRETPPRLLLTNIHQLDILMTRGRDIGMFRNAPLRFLVFDEAHTYTGVHGAETACLIRRLRAFCGKTADEVLCIGTSATLVDPESGASAGGQFAERFFGVPADRVTLVGEQYAETDWPLERSTPTPPTCDTVALLDRVIRSIEDEDADALRSAYRELSGLDAPKSDDVFEDLHQALRTNAMAYHISALQEPTELKEAVGIVWRRLKRGEPDQRSAQAEVLCYLALGAAAKHEGNPLLRPKLHYFAKGLQGAVLVFPDTEDGEEPRPLIYMSAAEAMDHHPDRMPPSCFRLLVCRTCGQHYARTWVAGLGFEKGEATGGQAEGNNTIWETTSQGQGDPVTFTDRFVSEADPDDMPEGASDRLDKDRTTLHVCRSCGTLHRLRADRCSNPKCARKAPLVPVHVVTRLQEDGTLRRCPACGEQARGFGDRKREPARPLQAVTVSDVHILAQDMINAAEDPHRKLICFADNRQDAAFQSGWMNDHARRYRLRHLVHSFVRESEAPVSIGDIVEHLMRQFEEDRDLAEAIATPVFEGKVDEAFGLSLTDNLRYFLRIQLILELTTSFRQRDSLETWGVVRVDYAGVTSGDPFIEEWAGKLDLSAEVLTNGVCSLLDAWRRLRYLHDPAAPIYGRWWREGDEQVMRGYIPFWEFPPKGLKLRRGSGDATDKVVSLLSDRGLTLARSFVAKWLPRTKEGKVLAAEFIEALWEQLTKGWGCLKAVDLVGGTGKVLPGTAGVYQVDAAKLGLVTQSELYRCKSCRRVHARPTPRGACTSMHCKGTLEKAEPPEHDYNVYQLGQPFSILLAAEHTAQVPAGRRETIEREFKQEAGRVNCLVSTPTLELGVDIGALDMVLMRNVPPQASNYWQRAGRAGREDRMAVIYTYCRRSLHDGYFYEDPTRILAGDITPPRFNLRNPVMLEKHVHAAVLSELIAMREDVGQSPLSEEDRTQIGEVLDSAIPNFICDYLFDEESRFRTHPYDVTPLTTVISKHQALLQELVLRVFSEHWPEEAVREVSADALGTVLGEMGLGLQDVVTRLHRRMTWAVETRRRLQKREHEGLLDEFERQLRRRCEGYLDYLHSRDARNYTLSVLAAEGFLPGYGSYDTGIAAFARRAGVGKKAAQSLQLGRPPALAIREFAPGNLIYADGARYRLSLYQLPVGEDRVDPDRFTVDPERGYIREVGTSAGYASDTDASILGMPICDCDLSYVSAISDMEENRFQVAVTVLGYLRREHRGGAVYRLLNGQELRYMLGQSMRLVNVGPTERVKRGEFGFPVCLVCGAVRSPFASKDELDNFRKRHSDLCGTEPTNVALTTDAKVDGFVIGDFQRREDAVNAGEALRMGAERTLEMEREDLHYLTVEGAEGCRLFLYDPMPGGSGLLTQVLERWHDLIDAAREELAGCASACETSCYDCMRLYRNLPEHGSLNRHTAMELLDAIDGTPTQETEIPPVSGVEHTVGGSKQANADRYLELTEKLGFPLPDREQRVEIGPPFDATVPDFSHVHEADEVRVAIYIDGMSEGIHGNAARAQQDRMIRTQLEDMGWDVLEIASSELDDPTALRNHFRRLAQILMSQDLLRKAKEHEWG